MADQGGVEGVAAAGLPAVVRKGGMNLGVAEVFVRVGVRVGDEHDLLGRSALAGEPCAELCGVGGLDAFEVGDAHGRTYSAAERALRETIAVAGVLVIALRTLALLACLSIGAGFCDNRDDLAGAGRIKAGKPDRYRGLLSLNIWGLCQTRNGSGSKDARASGATLPKQRSGFCCPSGRSYRRFTIPGTCRH